MVSLPSPPPPAGFPPARLLRAAGAPAAPAAPPCMVPPADVRRWQRHGPVQPLHRRPALIDWLLTR